MARNNALQQFKGYKGFCLCEMKNCSKKVLPFNVAAQSYKAGGVVKDLLLWAHSKEFLALVREKEGL